MIQKSSRARAPAAIRISQHDDLAESTAAAGSVQPDCARAWPPSLLVLQLWTNCRRQRFDTHQRCILTSPAAAISTLWNKLHHRLCKLFFFLIYSSISKMQGQLYMQNNVHARSSNDVVLFSQSVVCQLVLSLHSEVHFHHGCIQVS